MRIALHDMAEFRDSFAFLAQFNQRESLLQLGGGGFIPAGKFLQDQVVVFLGFLIVPLPVGHLGQIEIAIARQVGVRISLYVLGKFLPCQIVVAGVVIAQGVVVEHVGGRRLGWLRLRRLGREVLLRRLHVFQLLADFVQPGLEFVERVIQGL